MDQKFEMVAKTFQGLEDVLRDEIISLGAENVEMGRRMVSFHGDLATMYRANLCCRTALRILRPIEKFTAESPDELYDIVREIDWSKYMTPDTTFAIDSTINSGYFPHSQFVTYRVKDGIVDHFMDTVGRRPSIRVTDPDLLFNVHIDGDRITISLDSSGEPLSHRGYRVAQTEAPINEVLAAGIIMKTGWRGDCNFADPMCGSGTFLIEAALIAANINPGIYRENFAFEKWPDFDAELFEEIYNDDSAERDFNYKIYGGDIDADAEAIARRNIKSAKVEEMIELSRRPMADWTENPEPGVLVMNPPYGARLKPDDMTDLYRGIGSTLKKHFQGWTAWILGLNDEDFANIGLKPSMKIPLLNGSLECSLREYVLFDGRYNDFRADGGKVSHFEDDRDSDRGPRKMKRLSDDEWKKEARKFGHSDKNRDRRFDKKSKPQRSDRRYASDSYDERPSRSNFRDDRPSRSNFRDDRPSRSNFSDDRPSRSGFRDDRPSRSNFRDDRPSRSNFRDDRPSRSGFRDERPSRSGFRDERPSRSGFSDDRPSRSGFRDDRPSRSGFRPGSAGNRDRKPYGDRDSKPSSGKREAINIAPKGPKISADNAHIFSDVPMRSRRKKPSAEEPQNED